MENVMGLMKRSFDKERQLWVPAQINTVVSCMNKRKYGFNRFVMNPKDYVRNLTSQIIFQNIWLQSDKRWFINKRLGTRSTRTGHSSTEKQSVHGWSQASVGDRNDFAYVCWEREAENHVVQNTLSECEVVLQIGALRPDWYTDNNIQWSLRSHSALRWSPHIWSLRHKQSSPQNQQPCINVDADTYVHDDAYCVSLDFVVQGDDRPERDRGVIPCLRPKAVYCINNIQLSGYDALRLQCFEEVDFPQMAEIPDSLAKVASERRL